jgi:hypothetical protein
LGLSLAFRIATGPLVALIEWSAIIGLVLSLRRDLEHLHPAFVARMEKKQALEGEGTERGNATAGQSKLSATSRRAVTPANGAGDGRDGQDDEDRDGDGDEGGNDDFDDDDVHEMGEGSFTRSARVKSNSRHIVAAERGGVVLGSSPSDHRRAASDRKSAPPDSGVKARGPRRAEDEEER